MRSARNSHRRRYEFIMDVTGHWCVSVRIGFIGLRTETDSAFVLHFGSCVTYVATEHKTQK
jgi:hypothetical protein